MEILILIILAAIIFLLSRLITNKIFNDKLKSNIISGLMVLVLAPCIFYITLRIAIWTSSYHPERDFNAIAWHENIQDRHEMRQSILDNEVTIGQSKREIANILGLPIEGLDLDNDTLSNWRYTMGSQSWGFGLKFYYLDLKFKDNMATDVNVYESID